MSDCARCGAAFACGMTTAGPRMPCWCMRVPALPAAALHAGGNKTIDACLCPRCLEAVRAACQTQPPPE